MQNDSGILNLYCGKLYLVIISQKNKMLERWKYIAINVAYVYELINHIEICAKLYNYLKYSNYT